MSQEENGRPADRAWYQEIANKMRSGELSPEEGIGQIEAKLATLPPEERARTRDEMNRWANQKASKIEKPSPGNSTYLGRFIQRDLLRDDEIEVPEHNVYDAYRATRDFQTAAHHSRNAIKEGELLLVYPQNGAERRIQSGSGYAEAEHSMRVHEASRQCFENLQKRIIEQQERMMQHNAAEDAITSNFQEGKR